MTKEWGRICYAWWRDKRLTDAACRVLTVIVDRSKNLGSETEEAETVIKRSTIASVCGLTERGVGKALNCLEEAGYIERHSTGRATKIILKDNAKLPPKNKKEQKKKEQEKDYSFDLEEYKALANNFKN